MQTKPTAKRVATGVGVFKAREYGPTQAATEADVDGHLFSSERVSPVPL